MRDRSRRPVRSIHGDAVDADFPGRRWNQAAEHPQRRRLARAIRAEQSKDFARLHLECDVVHGGPAAEAAYEADRGKHACMVSRSRVPIAPRFVGGVALLPTK